jgi:Bacterial Ig-like domain (group 3)
MKRLLTSVAAVAVATVASGGLLAGFAGSAAAASAPPFEPDGNSVGALTLFNASGAVITGGSVSTSPVAAFVQGNAVVRAGDNKATLFGYLPVNGQVPGQWQGEALGGATLYPNAAAPAAVSATLPVETGVSGDETIADLAADFPNTDTTADGYAGIYQLRLRTSSTAGGGLTTTYDSVDIQITGSNWTVVYPAAVQATTTTLTASPNPALTTDSVTLTATEAPATAGSVDFKDGATDLGSAAVNGSGVATLSHTFATTGPHSLSAIFTPTSTATFGGSTGTATLTVNPPSTPTTTSLAVVQSGTVGTDVNLSSTVLAGVTPVTAGTVSWFDNGSPTSLNPTGVTPSASGVATFDIPAGLPQGSHSIIAVFTPTSLTQFEVSQSSKVTFAINAAAGTACTTSPISGCTDSQTITGTIPAGTLSISTPYTPTNPLNLGQLALNGDDTLWTAQKTFQCITVTDTTSGGSPFTASAQANALTLVPGTSIGTQSPSNAFTSINGENVGLTSLVPTPPGTTCPDGTTPTNSYSQPVAVRDNPAAAGVAPTDTGILGLGNAEHALFNGSAGGEGTVAVNGTLTLNAPTSTKDGQYTGTILFTVTD